jgi:hypothetical protein
MGMRKAASSATREDSACNRHRARSRNRPRRALAEDDHAEDFVLGDFGDARGADDAAVLHHANPVGQIEDVMDVMADQAASVGLLAAKDARNSGRV